MRLKHMHPFWIRFSGFLPLHPSVSPENIQGQNWGYMWAAAHVMNPQEGLREQQCLASEGQEDGAPWVKHFPLAFAVYVQSMGDPCRSITVLGEQWCKMALPSPALRRKQFLGHVQDRLTR